MSPEELTQAYWELYRKVFTFPAILRRTVLRRDFAKKPLRYRALPPPPNPEKRRTLYHARTQSL